MTGRVILLLCVLAMLPVQRVAGDWAPYPIRNGDFEREGGWARPQHWRHQVLDGEAKFHYNYDAPVGERFVQIIDNTRKTRWYQTGIPVFAGQYRLTLRARGTPGASAHVQVAGQTATLKVKQTWEDIIADVSVPKPCALGVYLYALGAGTVDFDNVSLDEVRIESAPVPTDGRPLGAVVLPESPSPAERFAAYELRRVLHAMTGVHLALAGRDQEADGRRVLIGRAATVRGIGQQAFTGEEEYAVVVKSDVVALAGGGDRGTLYAVYDFLNSLGCRWLMPGEIGEVIPRHERLPLPARHKRSTPDYAVRGYMSSYADILPHGGWIPADMDAILDYCLRNRFNALWDGRGATVEFGAHRGYGHEQTLNHSYRRLVPDSLFAEHPDWFPLVAGKHLLLHTSGRANQRCTANPQMREHVVQQALEYFDSHPRAKVFTVSHEDEPCYWCECPECRAQDSDGGKGPWQLSPRGRPPIPMTDRVVNFVNYIAARVAEKYPDRLIEMYAYSSTHTPPVRETVHPNILVKLCYWPLSQNHDIFDENSTRNRPVEMIRGWKARGLKHLGLYHYGDYKYTETPACWYAYTVRAFRALHKLGARSVLGETSNTMSGSALWYYLISRTLWDVETDSEAVIDDFCSHFYGPAAAPMAEYYRTLERAHREYAAQVNEDLPSGDDHETINNLKRWTPQVIQTARVRLDRATQAAGDDQLLQARIDRAWFSLLFTQAMATSRVGPKTEEAYAAARAAFDQAKRIQVARDIRSSWWGRSLLEFFWLPPLAAQTGELIMDMPLVWKFRLDPDDAGEDAGWAGAQPDADWADIRTDASWTDQGYSYHGTAWYTTQVATPEFPADRPIWLLFGAVDGHCRVWIDGRLAGTRMDPAGHLWDKSYALDVTELVRPGAKHRVTVKVTKDRLAAGIWKPVRIMLGQAGKTDSDKGGDAAEREGEDQDVR